MTEQRKDKLDREVFNKHIETIRRTLSEDAKLVFQMGIEMGYLYKSLFDEPLESEEQNKSK